jgi:hypothetical protein
VVAWPSQNSNFLGEPEVAWVGAALWEALLAQLELIEAKIDLARTPEHVEQYLNAILGRRDANAMK